MTRQRVSDLHPDMDEDENAAFDTDYHTEYGSGVEINSDYFTDGDLLFDSDFSPEEVITSFEHGAEVRWINKHI